MVMIVLHVYVFCLLDTHRAKIAKKLPLTDVVIMLRPSSYSVRHGWRPTIGAWEIFEKSLFYGLFHRLWPQLAVF